MNSKLFITIISIISALSIASVTSSHISDDTSKYAPDNSFYCDIFNDWDDVIC